MDFHLGEARKSDVGVEDGEVYYRHFCPRCSRPNYVSLRPGVPTEIKCWKCAWTVVVDDPQGQP